MINRGMWNVAGIAMIASKWSPVEDLSKVKLIPLWVELTNVPMSMYSWQGLSFITSAAGVPDHLHLDTLACKDFKVAKVFVKADLSKELPKKITYMIQGEETVVKFDYPWLPPKCETCGKWGHYATFCKKEKSETEEKKENLTTIGMKSRTKEKVEGKVEERVEEIVEERVGEQDMEKDTQREEGEKDWQPVSQEKAKRQSPNPKNVPETIVTPSRFVVLGNSEENEDEKEVDRTEDSEIAGLQENTLNKVIEDALKKTEESKGGTRLMPPRASKTNHRVLPSETSIQATDKSLGALRRGSRQHH